MKYFSDKGPGRLHPSFSAEFADDFLPIETELVRAGLAGGAISKRIIEKSESKVAGEF